MAGHKEKSSISTLYHNFEIQNVLHIGQKLPCPVCIYLLLCPVCIYWVELVFLYTCIETNNASN